MVSKITKKTPTKPSPNHHRRHRRKSSPLKSIAAAAPSFLAASIDRSIRSCRRRLIKIFTHLPILGTPKKAQKQGFRRLKSVPGEDPAAPLAAGPHGTLPPPSCPERRTVFLDLDETLVHSKTDPPPERYDFTVHPMIDGQVLTFYVLKRPGVDEMLREVSRSFEVVVFTAGLREYASLVLDRLDPTGEMISHRLYRDSCREMEGRFVKDLSGTGRGLHRAVIVDDNSNSYLFQPENGIPVAPFVDNLGDQELQRLMKFFKMSVLFDDMRDAIAYYHSYEIGVQRSEN